MPITINGTGSITGISAGGLPDASVTADDLASNAVTTAKIADANITAAKLDGAQSGSAPIYAARAWISHNSSTLQASGNISSLTRNGVGDYTVNFTTAMPDTNYAPVFMGEAGRIITKNTGSFNYARILDNGSAVDGSVGLAIFR